MGVKAWKVKLLLSSEDCQIAVEHTVSEWNRHSEIACLELLAMRRGDYGAEGAAVWNYLNQHSLGYGILEKITSPPRPGGDSEERQLAEAFRKTHGALEKLLLVRRALPSDLWRELIKAARERVLSYQEKLAAWKQDHEDWVADRAQWEQEHAAYMKIRPTIEDFQRREGQAGGRRGRWLRWMLFLAQTPGLAGWRGGDGHVVALTRQELAAASARRRKAAKTTLQLFFQKNPELKALDDEHGQYERCFARSGAKRRNPDGFQHRPTFTLPHRDSHPDWPRFKSGAGWKQLDLRTRTLALRLLCPDVKTRWFTVPFVPDPRLARLTPLQASRKEGKVNYAYSYVHPGTNLPTLAQPQGIKLIHRDGATFASITLTLKAADWALPVAQAACTKYGAGWLLKKVRQDAGQLALVSCAVDLAVRHDGAITIAREGQVFARRILHHRFYLPGGDASRSVNIPSLPEIAEVSRMIRCARRRSGRISPVVCGCAGLQKHYRGLRDDRYKKVVAAVFQYARHHGACLVIFEDLKGLRADAANERGVNAALQRWNRRQIVGFAQKVAEDYGLRVVTVRPFLTSQVCARCGAMGARFNRDRHDVALDYFGHWFACPDCRRQIHADLNASENLHRVFLGAFPRWQARIGQRGTYELDGRTVRRADVEARVRQMLVHTAIGPSPF